MLGVELRPLTLGEILDRSFVIYRRYFLLFVGISAVPQLFVLGVSLADTFFSPIKRVTGAYTRFALPSLNHTTPKGMLLLLLGWSVGLLAYALSHGGVILAIKETYVGREATITESLQGAWARIGTLCATMILYGSACVVGFFALVVPAFYVLCRLLVCLPSCVIESRGARNSLSRSWELTRHNAGRAFVLLLFNVVFAIGISYFLHYPISLALKASRIGSTEIRVWLALQELVNSIVVIFVRPIVLIAGTIFYFDLRIRKEALDLQLMLDPSIEQLT